MIKDEELMRLLCRAAALTRRRPEGDADAPRTRGYGHILATVAALTADGKGISQQQIADNAGVRPQSLSEAITALEERGYVERRASGIDKRKMLVAITPAGAEHSRILTEERAERARGVFGTLSDEDKEKLYELLRRLTSPRE